MPQHTKDLFTLRYNLAYSFLYLKYYVVNSNRIVDKQARRYFQVSTSCEQSGVIVAVQYACLNGSAANRIHRNPCNNKAAVQRHNLEKILQNNKEYMSRICKKIEAHLAFPHGLQKCKVLNYLIMKRM
ncbi:hypothetical protein EGR_06930 [Echinococcus granulosus]|uniref:Uncharacterized protein n=1 Tax=Echinococcus granulosus TaxID=6210 RepID=W6UC54_ECHGR|nr:hypothetical protein EGR_06930 [Echinococcus granulosus]EUB58186.1 hypothetical protein EGR_06930 [Echinococcus granulosus]